LAGIPEKETAQETRGDVVVAGELQRLMPSQRHPIPAFVEYDTGTGTTRLSGRNDLVKIMGIKDVRFKHYYAQVTEGARSEDGRAALKIVDVRPWGMAAPAHVGTRIRVLHNNLAYLPEFEYYCPSHPAVVEFDRIHMSPAAMENIRADHRTNGFTGLNNMHELRVLELPQGFLGASMYVDFSPPHAVPIAFVAGIAYARRGGASAMEVADSLCDEILPSPRFLVMSVPQRQPATPPPSPPYQQLGMVAKASAVAAASHNLEIEEISGQRQLGGQMQYLVKWAGYDPSWEPWRPEGEGEVGDPLRTWEPAKYVEGTQALADFKSQMAACLSGEGVT
jgi:hypothetical protein